MRFIWVNQQELKPMPPQDLPQSQAGDPKIPEKKEQQEQSENEKNLKDFFEQQKRLDSRAQMDFLGASVGWGRDGNYQDFRKGMVDENGDRINRRKKHANISSLLLKRQEKPQGDPGESAIIYRFDSLKNPTAEKYLGAGDAFPAEVDEVMFKRNDARQHDHDFTGPYVRAINPGNDRIGYYLKSDLAQGIYTYGAMFTGTEAMVMKTLAPDDPKLKQRIEDERRALYHPTIAPVIETQLPATSEMNSMALAANATQGTSEERRESQKENPNRLSETVFVGDSVTDVMKKSGSIEGAQECFKGGIQTGGMKRNFLGRYFDQKGTEGFQLKPEFQGGKLKQVVILGGINDITSCKSVSEVQTNLSAMYKAANEAGITVVACTLPPWDAERGIKIFDRDFKRKGLGSYPLTAEKLYERTAQLNQWILAQHNPQKGFIAIDLNKEMQDQAKYPRADFVHPTLTAGKAMAAYIKTQAHISDGTQPRMQESETQVAGYAQTNLDMNPNLRPKEDRLLSVQLREKFPRDTTSLDPANYRRILNSIASVTPPRGYRNLSRAAQQNPDLWAKIQRKAVAVLKDHTSPNALINYGEALAFEIDGKKFAAMLQPHPPYHNPVNHPGISVYEIIGPSMVTPTEISSRPKQRTVEKKKALGPLPALQDLMRRQPDFLPKVLAMAQRLRCDPRDILGVMYKESRLDPTAHNRSGATGLIQFMPDTALNMGTTVQQIIQMDAVQQLPLVERYFRSHLGKLGNFTDVYFAVFYPAALGRPDGFVIGMERSPEWARKVYLQNAGMIPKEERARRRESGEELLTVGDFKRYAAKSPFANLDISSLLHGNTGNSSAPINGNPSYIS